MKFIKSIKMLSALFILILFTSPFAFSANEDKDIEKPITERSEFLKNYDECLFESIKAVKDSSTLDEIKAHCEDTVAERILAQEDGPVIELGALANRIIREKRTAFDPYVITPHKMNYILPVSMTDAINAKAYEGFSDWANNLEDIETKFQISIKVPLITNHLFVEGDQIFFGFTLQSWWQIYSDEISKPFRETNYQPEFFYFAPINIHPFGGNSAIIIGLEHQSNGRSQLLSRSWNRVYFTYLYEKRNFALSLRPWYRIPEHEKSDPMNSEGDDNPDILDYMGHFELGMVYKYNKHYEFSIKARDNFATHKGFLEFGATFPLWGKLKGYAQVSSGYGDSLIDYNYNQNRVGLGIALTDIL